MTYSKLSNGIQLPNMMLGSFNINDQNIMNAIVQSSLDEGANGFDTSPSYGSEQSLGIALKSTEISRDKVFISDKIDGWQMQRSQGNIVKYFEDSLNALGTDYIDLLLIHWPFKAYLYQTWKSMERLYSSGRVHAIGLCNMDSRTYHEFLNNDISIKPHVIQIELSPLRTAEEDILLFQREGIVVEAYSPLCRMISEICESNTLISIAKKYNKSIAQIILRWHLERKTIPLFTSSKAERVKENLDIFDFHLSSDEIKTISSLNQDYKIFPESFGCPGY